MTVKGEGENYEKIIAEQLIRIGDILTAAFQPQIMQYNHAVKVTNENNAIKQEYMKLKSAYEDVKTHNADLMTVVEQKEKEDADNN